MKAVSILALVASLSLFGAEALRVEKRDSPAVLSLPLVKKSSGTPSKRSLSKRSGEVGTPDKNWNTDLLYLVELQIGTPPQSTWVQLIPEAAISWSKPQARTSARQLYQTHAAIMELVSGSHLYTKRVG